MILLHARYVKPYRRRNKTLRCHSWKKSRTQRINLLCGIFREMGLEAPAAFLHAANELVERPEVAALRGQLQIVLAETNLYEQCMVECEQQLQSWHADDAIVRKLDEVSGIGLLTACALKTVVGQSERLTQLQRWAVWCHERRFNGNWQSSQPGLTADLRNQPQVFRGCGEQRHCRNRRVLQRSKVDNNAPGDRLSAWPPLRELQRGPDGNVHGRSDIRMQLHWR